MEEMFKYVAVYGGLPGISLALVVYFFKDSKWIQSLIKKLPPEQRYRVLIFLMFSVFFICVSVVFGHFYTKINEQNITETTTKFRCEEVSRLVGIVARIASIKEKQIIADTDDLLILNALQENFIKYQKINPECDKLTSNGILTEIQQAESILKKYE